MSVMMDMSVSNSGRMSLSMSMDMSMSMSMLPDLISSRPSEAAWASETAN